MAAGRGGCAKRRLPFRCPSCAQPVREQRQCRLTVGGGVGGWGDSWSSRHRRRGNAPPRPLSPKKSEREMWGGNKSPSQETQGHAETELASPDNTAPTPPSSIPLLLTFTCSSIGGSSGGGGLFLQLNHVTFALSHFSQPAFEYEKGTISSPVKDRPFNDIWQSFDLLGFRGRGEEIH